MMQAAGWWFAAFDRGGQGRQRQPGVDRAADSVSDHSPRPGIQDDGDIGKAAADGDICDIGHPELVWAGGSDVGGEVREGRLTVIAVCCHREAATQSRLKVMLTHQAADLLVINDQALLAKRSLDAAPAIVLELVVE